MKAYCSGGGDHDHVCLSIISIDNIMDMFSFIMYLSWAKHNIPESAWVGGSENGAWKRANGKEKKTFKISAERDYKSTYISISLSTSA